MAGRLSRRGARQRKQSNRRSRHATSARRERARFEFHHVMSHEVGSPSHGVVNSCEFVSYWRSPSERL
eukprot:6036613-Pleurochrysis_carterae.AAC.1